MKNSVVISVEECKEKFLKTLEAEIGQEAGYDKLVKFLTIKSDFFTAPAAVSGPYAQEGGLARYSLDVYDRFTCNICNEDNLRTKNEKISEDQFKKLKKSGAVCCLLGDICYANHFEKVEGADADNSPIKYQVKANPLGYGDPDDPGIESVYMLEKFITLSRDESYAIRFHKSDLKSAYTQNAFRSFYLAYEVFRANLDTTFLNE